MPLLDTHTHLDDSKFSTDLEQVLENAKQSNISRIVIVSCDLQSLSSILQIQTRFPSQILINAGIHPNFVKSLEQVDEMIEWIQNHHNQIIGIGEVGLDFLPSNLSKGDETKSLQRLALTKFCQLALFLNLPLNVHSRSAGKPCLELLLEQSKLFNQNRDEIIPLKCLIHAFDGRTALIKQYTTDPIINKYLKCFFSVSPIVVRDSQSESIAAAIPIDRVVLETDSPALAAEKMTRNEPANIKLALSALSRIKNISEEELEKIIWKNSIDLFGNRIEDA